MKIDKIKKHNVKKRNIKRKKEKKENAILPEFCGAKDDKVLSMSPKCGGVRPPDGASVGQGGVSMTEKAE